MFSIHNYSSHLDDAAIIQFFASVVGYLNKRRMTQMKLTNALLKRLIAEEKKRMLKEDGPQAGHHGQQTGAVKPTASEKKATNLTGKMTDSLKDQIAKSIQNKNDLISYLEQVLDIASQQGHKFTEEELKPVFAKIIKDQTN